MPNKLFIPLIQGTIRRERKSILASRFIFDILSSYEQVKSEFVDPVDFAIPHDGNDEDNKNPRYSKITKEADGFFIVTPEYNHAFPGSLKRLLDTELGNYIHKPVAFAGVSSGQWGGVRAIEHLVSSVREMGMVTTFTDVQFPRVKEIFDSSGKMKSDLKDDYTRRVKRSIDELLWMTKTLKHGRENIASQYHQK